jgi:putative peptidoglycan lipid II flippase
MIARSRRALGLAAVSALARVPGFLIPVLLAAAFGAGYQTDAYFVAYGAALLVGGTLAQSVEVAIVPFAAREILAHGLGSQRFFDRTGLRVTLVAALLWLVVLPIVEFGTRPHLRGSVLLYAACFTPLVLFWSRSAVYAGGHVSQSRIATATGSAIWRGLGGLVALALMPMGAGLWAVGLGIGLGEFWRARWLRHRLLRLSDATLPHAPQSPQSPQSAALVGSLASGVAGVTVGAVMGAAAPVLEKIVAVSYGVGVASHLEYAYRLLTVPAVLFDGALAPMLLARWSQQVVTQGRSPTRAEILRPVLKGMAVAAGFALLIAPLSPTIVRVLLLHGRFTVADAAAVSVLLRGLSVGFVGTMGALLLERFFLSTGRGGVIAITSSLRSGVRVIVVLTLLPSLGILAFVVGYAVAEWTYVSTLAILARPTPAQSEAIVPSSEAI